MARLVSHTKSAVGGARCKQPCISSPRPLLGRMASPLPHRFTFDRIKEPVYSFRAESTRWLPIGDRRGLNPGPLGLQSSVLTTRPHGQPTRPHSQPRSTLVLPRSTLLSQYSIRYKCNYIGKLLVTCITS